MIAFASSLDQIGPFARTVADTALLLDAISGHDPRDSTSAARPVEPFGAGLSGDLRGLRVGVPRRLLETGVDADVQRLFDESLRVLESVGATLHDVELPHSAYAIPVYYLVATAEASSNLARYDGVRYGRRAADAAPVDAMYEKTRNAGFGAEVKRRIVLGTYVLSAGYYDAYYLKAQQMRTLIRRDYERAFETVDAVAMPTSPTPAFRLGERIEDPMQMYLADVFTVAAPLAGLPAISVPCGLTAGPAAGRASADRTRLGGSDDPQDGRCVRASQTDGAAGPRGGQVDLNQAIATSPTIAGTSQGTVAAQPASDHPSVRVVPKTNSAVCSTTPALSMLVRCSRSHSAGLGRRRPA